MALIGARAQDRFLLKGEDNISQYAYSGLQNTNKPSPNKGSHNVFCIFVIEPSGSVIALTCMGPTNEESPNMYGSHISQEHA